MQNAEPIANPSQVSLSTLIVTHYTAPISVIVCCSCPVSVAREGGHGKLPSPTATLDARSNRQMFLDTAWSDCRIHAHYAPSSPSILAIHLGICEYFSS